MNKKTGKNTQKLLFFEEVGKLERFGAKIQPKKSYISQVCFRGLKGVLIPEKLLFRDYTKSYDLSIVVRGDSPPEAWILFSAFVFGGRNSNTLLQLAKFSKCSTLLEILRPQRIKESY